MESPCSVISLLSISLNFFLICNVIAMAVIHYNPAVVNLDRSLSPNQVMASSLAVGFVFSAILSSFSCFCPDYILRSFQSLYLLVVVCFSIACDLENVQTYQRSGTHRSVSDNRTSAALLRQERPSLFSVLRSHGDNIMPKSL